MLDHNSKKSPSSKLVLSAILLLLWTGSAFGKAKHFGQLFLDTGAPNSTAQVEVYSGTALATLYSDSEGLVPLANPVTTSSDGVYWFYADNGRYTTVEEIGGKKRIVDPEVHVFDPSDPHTITATTDEVALTLTHIDSDEVETSTSMVLRREAGPEIETKGPWRMHYVGTGIEPAAPRKYMLLYNTDLQKDAAGNETWAPRDIDDVCILFETTAVAGPWDHGYMSYADGYLKYAVAPSGPAGTAPVFNNALNHAPNGMMHPASSLLKVGAGLDENTRNFRLRYQDITSPFGFSTVFLGPSLPEPQIYGEVRVIDQASDLASGEFKLVTSKGELHPVVRSLGSHYASAGEAFVQLKTGEVVNRGDTLVTSSQSGCAEVDNTQMDLSRIIGWAVEESGATRAGFVFLILK